MKVFQKIKEGFTLIELLLVIGIIATLASIVILAINPQKQLAAATEASRRNAANQIAKALTQYLVDSGSFPAGISTSSYSAKPICTSGVTSDATCVNIDTISPRYLPTISRDGAETTANYTGFSVFVQNGRIGVAPIMKSCRDILSAAPLATTGKYEVTANLSTAFSVYCDMTSDGGGWTIVNASSGAAGEQPIVSDTEALTGVATSFQAFNVSRAKKMALNALSTETLIKRTDGNWIKMSTTPFDSNLDTANTHIHKQTIITANNGASTTGYLGYSNFAYSGGGDFGVVTSAGFDHHNTVSYNHLNSGCGNHYFYSYGAGASYDVSTALGTWTVTSACEGAAGGTTGFYFALR